MVVSPDQYIADVLPLSAQRELADFSRPSCAEPERQSHQPRADRFHHGDHRYIFVCFESFD
ncbi:MAG: hypothetical protein EBY28_21500 [Betaproteobacteria bacterium]|nr:hypothetical protein [Betaproteobacteria bacterium]